MSRSKTYEASARRDGRWWLVEIPALDVTGQAAKLTQVDDVAREVAALVLNVEPEDVSVEVSIEVPEAVREAWGESRTLDAQAREASTAAATLARTAVKTLIETGLTHEEAGRMLGVSKQRIGQLGAGAHAGRVSTKTALGNSGTDFHDKG